MKKLTKKLKREWLAALRSGEYKQGRDMLKKASSRSTKFKYCCLGVLQAIEPKIKSESLYLLCDYNQNNSSIKGLSISEQYTLSNMNDNGIGFYEIANFIEDNIKWPS